MGDISAASCKEMLFYMRLPESPPGHTQYMYVPAPVPLSCSSGPLSPSATLWSLSQYGPMLLASSHIRLRVRVYRSQGQTWYPPQLCKRGSLKDNTANRQKDRKKIRKEEDDSSQLRKTKSIILNVVSIHPKTIYEVNTCEGKG